MDSQIRAFVCIQAEWENQNKQKSVVHLDSHLPPLLYLKYWASSTVSLNSREILGQDGYRTARWVPSHPGTTLTNEKPDASYLVGTFDAKDQCKRLNRWEVKDGSTYREKVLVGLVFSVYILYFQWNGHDKCLVAYWRKPFWEFAKVQDIEVDNLIASDK